MVVCSMSTLRKSKNPQTKRTERQNNGFISVMLLGEFQQIENFKRQRHFGLYFECCYLIPRSNTGVAYLVSEERRLRHPEKTEPKGEGNTCNQTLGAKWEWKRSVLVFFFLLCLFISFCVINWLFQYAFKVCKSLLSQKFILACA